MDPFSRWDDWEWEKAAQEMGRSSQYDVYDREKSKGKKYYFKEKPVRSFADKWTGSQKRVVLSALLLLSIVFSSKGQDLFSQNVYAFYRTGMESGNLYTSLNSMAKEAMGISGSEGMVVNAPIQSIFYPPVAGVVKVGFHGENYTGGLSNGIEIESTAGTPALCPNDGVVLEINENKSYGKMVRINLGDGWEGILGNLGAVTVKTGDPVSMGTVIGVVGISSESQRPWLYFELRQNGKAVNPLNYLMRHE